MAKAGITATAGSPVGVTVTVALVAATVAVMVAAEFPGM